MGTGVHQSTWEFAVNAWLERHKVLAVSVLATIIVGGIGTWVALRPRPGPIIISTPEPTPTPVPEPTATPAPLRVYVTGAVHRADVYLVPAGSLVKDVIDAAGGATDDADLEQINLAVQVYDQQQIHVPRKGESVTPIAAPVDAPAGTGTVNINTASVEELDTLPGIGPAIAQRIVDYRTEYGPFATIEDITNVKGIGPATFEKLKGLITVQ
jgi:competence protein ComEA